jgi:hypothetical protein
MISDNENRVLEAVRQCGPLEAYRRLIAENNTLIPGSGFEEWPGDYYDAHGHSHGACRPMGGGTAADAEL